MSPTDGPSRRGLAAGLTRRRDAGRQRVYRLLPPVVIWWAWLVVAVASLVDLAVQGHDLSSLRFALGMLTATGVVFACTLWPKVIAGEDSITVLNPFRVFVVPWGSVRGIFLGESVEIACSRGEGKKDKTVYCWALPAPRRARARAELRARQRDQGKRSKPSAYDRMPQAARDMARLTPAEIYARELAQQADQAGRTAGKPAPAPAAGSVLAADSPPVVGAPAASQADGGASQEVVAGRWAWPPVVATAVPAIGFAVAMLLR